MTITAAQALPGDVLQDSAGTEWKRGPRAFLWRTFDGPVLFEGPWRDEYGPQGLLTVLARGGKPVSG